MGSSTNATATPSPAFLAAFSEAAGHARALTFERFMELALYHPQAGYYRQARRRVGYGRGTDFYTASSSGAIFGELIVAAVRTLLGSADPARFTFVEIGAEPGGGILHQVAHPFRATRTIGVGEPITLSDDCVVFSNELFDAQPCCRFVRQDGAWRELGVARHGDTLEEVTLPATPPPELPAQAPDGYVIDVSFAARDLLKRIAAQPWRGLFIACDYGKSWRELCTACPAGTARAYHQHTQSNQLLDRPGEQDLTCHVCWDWLEAELSANGFQAIRLDPQETFLVRQAGAFINTLVAAEAGHFSQRKLALTQLLHPAHLGQKFQVLHARRD